MQFPEMGLCAGNELRIWMPAIHIELDQIYREFDPAQVDMLSVTYTVTYASVL